MSGYEHLHQVTAENIEQPPEARIQWLKKPRWIGYPRAQEIMGKLEDLVSHPREERMPNMLLIGGTNNGKTRLIRNFAQRHMADENVGGEHIIAPVLYTQAPPAPNEAGFYSEILNTLFERVPTSSTDAKRARVIQVLRGVKLKVLIIDELHNILAGASVKQQQFLNMIKYLGNELQISIVGCGTGDLLRAVSIDPQIQNRFVPEILPKWQLNKEYRQLLMSFERVLPLRKPSALHEPQLATKILAMSEGTIGELSALLNLASIHAIRGGQEHITTDVLNACGYVSPSDRTKQAARV
ncbi:TniB family NTP-binding protein [Metapseudomonas otitidis]|uniref:TniB family NTP-binding protein n=1 Tax=Metapseudomonas otitidis TaxID=319939 RepID=UPI0024498EC8|nr:TniB family NTP-binding protein [Pseudomonas otitidis]MDH0334626.1 TniB family NTP-binding protein [Pseudomonas otitidis]